MDTTNTRTVVTCPSSHKLSPDTLREKWLNKNVIVELHDQYESRLIWGTLIQINTFVHRSAIRISILTPKKKLESCFLHECKWMDYLQAFDPED